MQFIMLLESKVHSKCTYFYMDLSLKGRYILFLSYLSDTFYYITTYHTLQQKVKGMWKSDYKSLFIYIVLFPT